MNFLTESRECTYKATYKHGNFKIVQVEYVVLFHVTF